MAIVGLNEDERQKAEERTRLEMEQLSAKLKDLILSQPPQDLLGYLWSRLLMTAMHPSRDEMPPAEQGNLAQDGTEDSTDQLDLTQLILEYVHATWSSFESGELGALDESVCADIANTAGELKAATFNYCILSTASVKGGIFGDKSSEIEFLAKSNWVLIRSHRYQVLEKEFYAFVLSVHDDALRTAFGIGAGDIAAGIQAITDAMRVGHMRAANSLFEQMEAANAFAAERGLTFEQAAEDWKKERPDRVAASASAIEDLFRGEICNLSKHTKLPPSLLEALAFERGGNVEFFAPGPLSGTPLRTLPARVKPLVKIDNDYFATDPSFVRDTGYRAILWNLLDRVPAYKDEFNRRQKEMSEAAFPRILSEQMAGARVHNEIWYKDPSSGQWVENDTLIRLDDVLILVEAKAGAAATIASPAVDFERHVRSVQDLVTKAYLQCRRFLEYLNSGTEMPLFKREAGKYVEFDRIGLCRYRVVLPIGLTVESFAPYSAMCKELPGIEPILGKYPYISMSIDDLFILKRFLLTTGELVHYLEVRQSVAGIKGSRLFDEIDHLGAYIQKNRFDEDMREQLSEGADLALWDGFSAVVDQHFEGDDWEARTPPKQTFSSEVVLLLDALNSTKAPGWFAADSHIRNFGQQERERLAAMLRQTLPTLAKRESRWFQVGDGPPLFVWLQRDGAIPDLKEIRSKANAATIAVDSTESIVIVASVVPNGGYSRAERIESSLPAIDRPEYAHIRAEASQLKARRVPFTAGAEAEDKKPRQRLPGRNEPCWCGSGKKFKKCHGGVA